MQSQPQTEEIVLKFRISISRKNLHFSWYRLELGIYKRVFGHGISILPSLSLSRSFSPSLALSLSLITRWPWSAPLTKEIRLKIFGSPDLTVFLLDLMGFLVQICLRSYNIHPKASLSSTISSFRGLLILHGPLMNIKVLGLSKGLG